MLASAWMMTRVHRNGGAHTGEEPAGHGLRGPHPGENRNASIKLPPRNEPHDNLTHGQHFAEAFIVLRVSLHWFADKVCGFGRGGIRPRYDTDGLHFGTHVRLDQKFVPLCRCNRDKLGMSANV